MNFTFISSIINHFDVKRLFSCALSSVDNDVDEFNVVELVMIDRMHHDVFVLNDNQLNYKQEVIHPEIKLKNDN